MAIWVAVASTTWLMFTVFPLRHAQLLGIDPISEKGRMYALGAGLITAGYAIWTLNCILYVAEPRRGLKRAILSLAVAAGIVAWVTVVTVAFDSPAPFTTGAMLGFGAGQSVMVVGMLVLAAIRWVGAGLAADRGARSSVSEVGAEPGSADQTGPGTSPA